MTIEVTAKKIDDAISQGLKQLGASLDEVNVEVVEAGGLFRKAKVRITLDRAEAEQAETAAESKPSAPTRAASDERIKSDKPHATAEKKSDKPTEKHAKPQAQSKNAGEPSEQKRTAKSDGEKADGAAQDRKQKQEAKKQRAQTRAEENAEQSQNAGACGGERKPRQPSAEDKLAAEHALTFVKETIEKMGFGATVEADESGENIVVTAAEGDDSLIIGRHGETLSALSYLAETCARAEKSHISVSVDCNGYRERRAASLTAMARRRANECAAKRRKIKLEPMERVDRRTVHNALTDDDRVTTASEGKEPYRCVVIIPKNDKNNR